MRSHPRSEKQARICLSEAAGKIPCRLSYSPCVHGIQNILLFFYKSHQSLLPYLSYTEKKSILPAAFSNTLLRSPYEQVFSRCSSTACTFQEHISHPVWSLFYMRWQSLCFLHTLHKSNSHLLQAWSSAQQKYPVSDSWFHSHNLQ